jgi:type IV pilus assembly protein PilV
MNTSKRHTHMRPTNPASSRQAGFTMIEVLVSLLIIVLGLLGLAGLQARINQAEFESYQRTQALILLHDMVDRINVNRVTATCFDITTNVGNGTPFLGVGAGGIPACAAGTAAENANAIATMTEWSDLLQGAAEVKGGNLVGAMIGARGCVSYDAASELLDPSLAPIGGTGIWTVAVAWQGTSETAAPTMINEAGVTVPINCANNLYGDAATTGDRLRRAVATTFRLARLN